MPLRNTTNHFKDRVGDFNDHPVHWIGSDASQRVNGFVSGLGNGDNCTIQQCNEIAFSKSLVFPRESVADFVGYPSIDFLVVHLLFFITWNDFAWLGPSTSTFPHQVGEVNR